MGLVVQREVLDRRIKWKGTDETDVFEVWADADVLESVRFLQWALLARSIRA